MKFLMIIGVVAAMGAAVACSSGDDDSKSSPTASSAPSTTAAGNVVEVEVQEWSINPAVKTVAAGPVTFHVKNNGPTEEHEFVIIKTDLAAADLPKLPDGSVDEEDPSLSSPGEIEGMGAGEEKSGTFDLAPGNYQFICNLIDHGTTGVQVHFTEGMHTSFTVQ